MAKYIVTVKSGAGTKDEEFVADRLSDAVEGRWIELRKETSAGGSELVVRLRADDVRRVRRED